MAEIKGRTSAAKKGKVLIPWSERASRKAKGTKELWLTQIRPSKTGQLVVDDDMREHGRGLHRLRSLKPSG